MTPRIDPGPAFCHFPAPMRDLLPDKRPALALAPMQDITHLAFMRTLVSRSLPDWFVTEFFRAHSASTLEKHILRAVREHGTGRPVFAQIIGAEAGGILRTARELAAHPIAGIDLNLGCPSPTVCRKRAGAGLLRQPAALAELLGRLRDGIAGVFTVKTRLGHASAEEFSGLLEIFRPLGLDGVTVHARTVLQGYRGPVDHARVRQAVDALDCPVLANGNIVDVATGLAYQRLSGAAGLMVGRGAIRNPWIFGQLRAAWENRPPQTPVGRDLLRFIEELWENVARESPVYEPEKHVNHMKRSVCYICHGLGEAFEHELRRSRSPEGFWEICRRHLDHAEPLPAQPPPDSHLFSGFRALVDDAADSSHSPA